MAKPTFDDKLVEEFLVAITASKDAVLPSSKLIAALAKSSGKMEGSIRQRFVELFHSVHGTDGDPFLPNPGERE